MAEFLRLRNTLERIIAPIAAKYGLTPVQSVTLHLIAKSENATVGSIFREFDLNQGNVSTVCKKLEADGFIIRTKSVDDERKFVIALTEKGENAIHGIEDGIPAFLPFTDSEITREFSRLTDGLRILKDAAHGLNCAITEKNNGENNNA